MQGQVDDRLNKLRDWIIANANKWIINEGQMIFTLRQAERGLHEKSREQLIEALTLLDERGLIKEIESRRRDSRRYLVSDLNQFRPKTSVTRDGKAHQQAIQDGASWSDTHVPTNDRPLTVDSDGSLSAEALASASAIGTTDPVPSSKCHTDHISSGSPNQATVTTDTSVDNQMADVNRIQAGSEQPHPRSDRVALFERLEALGGDTTQSLTLEELREEIARLEDQQGMSATNG